jgi:hypothetical protein
VSDLDYVGYSVRWKPGERLAISPSVGYQSGDLYTPTKRSSDWFSAGLDATYKIGPKLTSRLRLQRSESGGSNSYTQNGASIDLTYTF